MANEAKPKAAPVGGLAGDLWGALASMLVALPSSIAFGVLVFTAISPDHAGMGAMAGALGAAALGLVEPLVGRNGGFITAPCAPAAAVMSGLAVFLTADQGLDPGRVVSLMVLAALISAVLQIVYGAIRLGRFIKYIPFQVVSGYLSGVAVIIAISQLPKLLGLTGGVTLGQGLLHPGLWRWPGIVVGLVTIVVTGCAPLVTRRVPAPILGLLAGVGTYFGLGLIRPDLLVLENNALVVGPMGVDGSLVGTIVGRAKSLTGIRLTDVKLVLSTAATLSVLLSIDTLKTGVVLDALTRTRHASNRELVAQGVGNVASALVGGMPGAGTMGPTLVNVTSGGRSPRSGFAEGVLCIVAFLALSSLIAWIPIGALAGILLVIAFKMFDWKAFKLLRNARTRLDFAVIITVVLVAVGAGLIASSAVGIALAILLFIRAQMRGSVVLRQRNLRHVASKRRRLDDARAALEEDGDHGLLVELQGDLFFGTTDQLYTKLTRELQTARFILLDLRRVQSIDYTGGHLLRVMQDQLADRGGSLLFSGLPSGTTERQDIENYLRDLALVGNENGIPVHQTRNEGLEWMEDRILEAAGLRSSQSPEPELLSLGEIELLREFDDEMLEKLEGIAREVHVLAGEMLFSRGEPGDELFLIRRGSVDVLLPLPGGKRHHLATFGQGDYLGELAFLDRGLRSADGEARTQCDLYAFSRKQFDTVARTDALIPTKVFARLALAVSRRLRAADAELRALEER